MSRLDPVDLHTIARRAAADRGFEIYFPPSVGVEIKKAKEPKFSERTEHDLTNLFWSSIDNDDSKDLDQIEYAEKTADGMKLFIGIADVNTFVPQGSATDLFAQKNTTSVYTGIETFPMLPLRFSTDLTSLNEGKKRLAVVVELTLNKAGKVVSSDAYRAVVLNKAQLTYHSVSAWLEKGAINHQHPVSSASLKKLENDPALQEQILLQDSIAQALRKGRAKAGALDFRSAESRPQVHDDGTIEFRDSPSDRAPGIIEEFMIAANEGVDAFLASKKYPTLQRIVRTPKNWSRMVVIAKERGDSLPNEPESKALQEFLTRQEERDPKGFPELSFSMVKLLGRGEYVVKLAGAEGIGHFGLATPNYSHATAPNRRYSDLLTQRLLFAAFENKQVPYAVEELERLAKRCTDKEDDANRVERQVTKSVIAVALTPRIGEIFEGIITGVSEKGTFIRISNPFAEGRIEGDTTGVAVGDHARVKLTATDPNRGFIDFELHK